MTFGPGKYDDCCTIVRQYLGMTEETGGGVCVVVFGGPHGPGFSVQADFESALQMPDIFERVAQQIRKDVAG